MSRGVWRMFAVALTTYQQTLETHALLDFSGVLERAIDLLKQMDEFARSRYRLEARYHHVLVDEFQDTSRAQWELVAQLVRSWGEGLGASADALPPSIFIVGDRKQSIYGFRDAEVAILEDAARLHRSASAGRRSAAGDYGQLPAVPPLLRFVNDVFGAIEGDRPADRFAFRYGELDRFPAAARSPEPEARSPQLEGPTPKPATRSLDLPLGLVVGETVRSRPRRPPRRSSGC